MQGPLEDVRLILYRMPAVGPQINRRVETGVYCEVVGIPLMGRPPCQLYFLTRSTRCRSGTGATKPLTAGHRPDDQKRLFAGCHRLG
jgi:hypothetical protein